MSMQPRPKGTGLGQRFGAPKIIKKGVAKADAEAMKKKHEDAGAKVSLK